MPAFRNSPRRSTAQDNHILRDAPRIGFDPRYLSARLVGWARSDLATEMNGSTVSAWDDMSGNGNDLSQSTAADQPALASGGLGGRPELTFDGSSDVLDGPSLYGMLSAYDDWSVVVVVRGWTWGSGGNHYDGRAVLGAPTGGGGYFNQTVLTEGAGGLAGGFYNGSAHQTAKAASAGDQGAAVVWSMIDDGGDLTIRVNGTAGTTISAAGSLPSEATTLGVGYGTSGGVGTQYWDGAISEVLIFDGVLGEGEIGPLESYLGDRYGIQV